MVFILEEEGGDFGERKNQITKKLKIKRRI